MEKITLQIYKDELGSVHGAVMPLDGPGEYAIVLNRNESGPEQLAAFIHEMIHRSRSTRKEQLFPGIKESGLAKNLESNGFRGLCVTI